MRLRDRIARVLVVAGPAHGDILLATPLLASLKRFRPDALVDVLVYTSQADILAGNPHVSSVLSASKHPRIREYMALAKRIARRYDLAISPKQTDRAVAYAIVAGNTRIAVVPPGRDPWKRWLTQGHVLYDHYNTHTIVQNRSLLATIGIEGSTEVFPPTAADAPARVTALLESCIADEPFAVLHLNPGLPHKRWTLTGWEEVAHHLHRRGLRLLLTGDGRGEEGEYLAAAMRRLPDGAVNLAGRLRFADLTELLRRSVLYVGTDTVAAHIAAATGVPTVALFGPEPARVWGPWPKGGDYDRTPFPGEGDQRAGNVLVVQTTTPCPTCRQGDCLRRPERKRSCTLMLNLGAEQVIAGIERLLGDAAPRSGAPARGAGEAG